MIALGPWAAMPVLLAAFEWFQVVVVAVGVVIYLVNRLLQQGAKPPAGGRPPQGGRVVRPVPPAGGGNMPRDKLDDEVSEFLRRAAGRRGAQGNPGPRDKPLRRIVPIEAEVVAAEVVERPGRESSVARHVQEHLDTRSFEARARQLTHLDDVDERLQEHVHQVFDHALGSLDAERAGGAGGGTPAPSTAEQPPAPPPVDLTGWLASPQSIVQVVVAQEILRRPDDRW